MNARIGLVVTLALLVGTASSGGAAGLPIAPMNLGVSNVIYSDADRMIATYLGTGASYSNDLYLMLDGYGNVADDGDLTNDLLVFNNHASIVGGTFEIDKFVPGQELLFRLFVHDTGYNYYSGASSRNADGKAHAMFLRDWKPGYSLVSFEDLYGTPEYQRGYNDLSFSFRHTRISEVPEPHAAGLLLIGVLGMFALRGRRAR